MLLLACSHEPPAATPGAGAATAAHTAAAHDAPGHAAAAGHGDEHGHGSHAGAGSNKNKVGGKEQAGSGFAVPFVWETSKTDPLAVARGHLKEILGDNAAYVTSHPKLDPTKIVGAARTTIVTCSDAAVQLDALDRTPENDTFVTRNWGNLLEPSLGTVSYGIEELHTPVLLIVGHTGCDAVKAVLEGTKFSKAIRSQIGKLKLRSAEGADDAKRVNAAVIDNVNRQVQKAVQRFQPLVRTGVLTIIGAVYDPTNALGRGQGRLSIVNVNTITDPVSMDAFVTAVTSDDKIVQALALEHEAHDEHAAAGGHEAHDEHAAAGGHAVGPGGPSPRPAAVGHHDRGNEGGGHTSRAAPSKHAAPQHQASDDDGHHGDAHAEETGPSNHGHAPAKVEAQPHGHERATKASSSHDGASKGSSQASAAGGSRTSNGLPQIDHLEPSLIRAPH